MKIKSIIYLTFAVLILTSCEGQKGGNGKVLDNNEGFPLDSVKYKCIETEEVEYTDSLGNWEMYGKFGGCVPDCLDFNVEFSKSGYKTQIFLNPDGNISLEKE
jgi:hypothetical protein